MSEDGTPVAAAPRVWAPMRLEPYRKHRPPEGLSWQQIVDNTKNGNALYCITEADQRQAEAECLMNGPLLREIKNKRMFFMEMDQVIGASEGVETKFIYVEWLVSGECHGRPITEQELKRKGAQL
jgi:hypothetical protein